MEDPCQHRTYFQVLWLFYSATLLMEITTRRQISFVKKLSNDLIVLSFIYPEKIFSVVASSFSKKNSPTAFSFFGLFGAHPPRTRKTLLLLSNCYKNSMEEHPSHSQDVNISLRRVLVSDRSVIFIRCYIKCFLLLLHSIMCL